MIWILFTVLTGVSDALPYENPSAVLHGSSEHYPVHHTPQTVSWHGYESPSPSEWKPEAPKVITVYRTIPYSVPVTPKPKKRKQKKQRGFIDTTEVLSLLIRNSTLPTLQRVLEFVERLNGTLLDPNSSTGMTTTNSVVATTAPVAQTQTTTPATSIAMALSSSSNIDDQTRFLATIGARFLNQMMATQTPSPQPPSSYVQPTYDYGYVNSQYSRYNARSRWGY